MFDLCGQWQGYSKGVPEGKVILDAEESDGQIHGIAYLFTAAADLPDTVAYFNFKARKTKNSRSIETDAQIGAFDSRLGRALNAGEMKTFYPETKHSDKAHFKFKALDTITVEMTWNTPAETFGEVVLKKSVVPDRSHLAAESDVRSWSDFREKLSGFTFEEYVFRGQRLSYPLQTSFHRTRRKNLHRYLHHDVQTLHRRLTGITRHLFDLEKPQELGAFFNLAQHHGFPTPLLDWSYSPFVAAWFAFNEVREREERDEPVRIFCLNKKVFSQLPQFQNVTFSPPHFSILETLAVENRRAIPQQGLLTLTNINDIESYISELEEENGQSYLTAYDLAISDVEEALNDLAMMGITRSTLFPSIESICRDLRERLFV